MNPLALAADAAAAGPIGDAAAFWIFGGLAVLGALGLVLARKAVHSALCMALTMMNLAALYAVNGATFLAMVQVIVYTGAVMMLFLFVLMIVGVSELEDVSETLRGQRFWGAIMVAGFGILVISGIGRAMEGIGAVGVDAANQEFGGNAQGLAMLIFSELLLPFEVVAALLITAALGALVLAHRERWEPKPGQRRLSQERFRSGVHPGVLPNPGVISSTNAVGTAALLPDGSPSLESIPIPLRAHVDQPAPPRSMEELLAGEARAAASEKEGDV